ncbi:hypothetical protein [Megasphaera sp.]|uniref:hypothetical protein n=1 Tax=Megasphaera sp. TaxID=2023260 RepID=UPI00307974AA
MLKIIGNNIYHIRGDTDSFDVDLTQEDGSDVGAYTAVFSVKRNINDAQYAFQAPVQDGVVSLTHDMTANLDPGDYVWDVEVRFQDGGYQTIGPGLFRVLADVTR